MILHDHIGIFPNAISEEMCDKFVTLFDDASKHGFAYSRQEQDKVSSLMKDDMAVFMSDVLHLDNYRASSEFKQVLWANAYAPYASKYAVLSDLGFHTITDLKLQRTEVGGGYHVWHCEQASRNTSQRLMAFTVYLNTVDEGGETEFLYQAKRVKAEKGTAVLFPASYTHTHRGNPPLSGVKYIATGWVEF